MVLHLIICLFIAHDYILPSIIVNCSICTDTYLGGYLG